MAVKFIFEDGEGTPSSLLLKSSYYGEYIYFSNGVSRLLDKAMEVRKAGDSIFLFYDMSPNNLKTVKGYEALLDIIKQDKLLYHDIFVIPILCIEYHVCQAFVKYNWFYVKDAKENEMIEKLVVKFDWANISDEFKNNVYINASLEHAYKSILANLKMRCMHNAFEYVGNTGVRKNQSISGKFYEKDCDCERKYCPIECTDSLKLKAEKVYCTLPGFVVSTDEHRRLLNSIGIKTVSLSLEDVKAQRRVFYKMVCANMGLPLPSIDM